MKRAVGPLLVALAVGLLACRFVRLDLASFARDEPQFLTAARAQLSTGHWLSANPLYGNMGLRYGPTAFWFYGAVQRVFGEQPRTAILAMGLTVTLAHLAFIVGLKRLFAEDAYFLAALLAWFASSPYQFHWSRLAWDLTSNAGAFAAVALLCGYRDLRPGRAIALGLALGLGVGTHPMLAPLVVAVGLTLAWELRSGPRRALLAPVLALAALVAVNVPYLIFLLRARVVARAIRLPFSFADLGALVLDSARLTTPWGLAYFFDGGWPDFLARLGAASGWVSALSLVALVAVTAATLAGLAVAFASSDPHHRRIARVALLAWGGTVVLIAALGLERHPHYQFACAWVPIFGVAAGVSWLRRRSPRLGAAALGVLGALALCQCLVIVQWMGFIRDVGGTRGPTYGTPLGQEIETMRAVCSGPEPRIVLTNSTAMYPFPFRYLASTEPACRDKTVLVCAPEPASPKERCPPPAEGARWLRLRYANERGGALRID